MQAASVLAVWWGYANGNATVVGVVVALIGLASIAYVARRVARGARGRA